MRYLVRLKYNGSEFNGWQIQPSSPSVQETLEQKLSMLLGMEIKVVGCGRTDTGVHATGQVAHIDFKKAWDPHRLQQALNFYLKPKLISIIASAKVDSDFHARFSAVKRHYLFKILNRTPPLTLDKNRYWHVNHRLDLKKMKKGASYLIGKHDFTTFRSTLCQAKSPIKSIDKIEIINTPYSIGSSIQIKFTARSYLHNQIRSIVGTLGKVGSNSWEPERVNLALLSKNRAECGPVAPAAGLYLVKIDYKNDVFL